MNIQLFNFLEDHWDPIKLEIHELLLQHISPYQSFAKEDVDAFLDHTVDAYIDLMVTGQTDNFGTVFKPLVEIILHHGKGFNYFFIVPLLITNVVRDLLTKDYKAKEGGSFSKDYIALHQTSRLAFMRFLEIYETRITTGDENQTQTQKSDNKLELKSFFTRPEE